MSGMTEGEICARYHKMADALTYFLRHIWRRDPDPAALIAAHSIMKAAWKRRKLSALFVGVTRYQEEIEAPSLPAVPARSYCRLQIKIAW